MKAFFIIFILFACSPRLFAQNDSVNLSGGNYNIDSLKILYGDRKSLLSEYEAATLIALSYYPELKNEYIRFKFASINSTARTTVSFASIFKKIDKQYIIYINNDILRTGVILNQAPFDAQVALIGHELAHVTDFKRRGFFDMAWWAISYLFVKQRTKIEKLADKTTIRHGLGWPLYHWSDFVLHHSTANKQYLRMKEARYLSPDDILKYMKEHSYLR